MTSTRENIDALVAALKNDGLATGNNIDVKINNGIINLNGKELSAEVSKKYESYFPKGNEKISVKVDTDKK